MSKKEEQKNVCPITGLPCDKEKCLSYKANNKQTYHVCDDCVIDVKKMNTIQEMLSSVLSSLFNKSGEETNKICDGCNSSLQEIFYTQRLGCPKCYDVFKNEIDRILISCQEGKTKHIGKHPNMKIQIDRHFQNLVLTQQEAIKKEDYETAAKIRDQLKLLEPIKIKIDKTRQEIFYANQKKEIQEVEKLMNLYSSLKDEYTYLINKT